MTLIPIMLFSCLEFNEMYDNADVRLLSMHLMHVVTTVQTNQYLLLILLSFFTCFSATIQAIAAYLDAFQKIADAATNSKGKNFLLFLCSIYGTENVRTDYFSV